MKRITIAFVTAAMALTLPQTIRADFGNHEHFASTHVSRGDAKFIREAAEGNNAEIGLAEVVLRKSADPQVKHYAEMLIRDHRQSNRELEQIATARGIAWPVPVKKSDARDLQRAENMNPRDLDRMVINHWVKDHRSDIKEFESAARHATDPQVKEFALSSIPTLRQHLNGAENLASAGVIREPAGSHHYYRGSYPNNH
jgi:putative membrane protein